MRYGVNFYQQQDSGSFSTGFTVDGANLAADDSFHFVYVYYTNLRKNVD